jgi:hypothetical protein
MSDVVAQGEATDGGATEAPSQTAAEIFHAEVAALKAAEEGGAKRASDYGVAKPKSDPFEEGAEEQVEGSGEVKAEAEGSESDELSDDPKRKPYDWKKEALESRQAFDALKAEVAELKQALRQPAPQQEQSVKKDFKVPDVKLDETELSQELKDLLEYTPGLDKMVASLAAKTAQAIIDKAETDRELKEQGKAEARKREESDKNYWSGLESWVKGQHPELSISEIRKTPDFKDWADYHKTWVDTQLSSVAYDDISGAQKVFDRYISEKGLAKKEQDTGNRNLAAARSPATNRKSAPPIMDKRSLFQQETEKLKAHVHRFRSTI